MSDLLKNVTWRHVGITFVANAVVVALAKWMLGIDNPYPDLLVSGQVIGFSIMFAVSAAGTLRLRRIPRPVAQLIAVALSSVVGTALVVVVKGRDLIAVLTASEGIQRFSFTAFLGMGFGGLITAFFIFRERDAQARAALHKAEAEKHLIARQMVEAQLALMQAQVEPHFLFNTLANVRYLVGAEPERAMRVLDHLIDYLKAALPQMRGTASTLGKEIELAGAYLSIQQIRMGERLRFGFDVPLALQARPFPPAMVITLVENAIKHGLGPKLDGGDVAVSAIAEGGKLRLTVADTGAGMTAESGSGIGLTNLRNRLQGLYGDDGRLIIERNAPSGMRATIEIPDAGAQN